MAQEATETRRSEKSGLSRQDLANLRSLLLKRRDEIFRRVRNLQSGMKDLSEPQPEPEENAQGAELMEPYERLDERELTEVREIDLAINRMADGTYGVCENCGNRISLKRLYAIPWTRLCLDCSDESRH